MFNDNNDFDESQLNYTNRQYYNQLTYDEKIIFVKAYRSGYKNGENNGREDGHYEGYDEGRDNGYNNGYDDGGYDETQGLGPFNDNTWPNNNSDNPGLWPRNPPKGPFNNNDDNH